jgi:hypothetical protein
MIAATFADSYQIPATQIASQTTLYLHRAIYHMFCRLFMLAIARNGEFSSARVTEFHPFSRFHSGGWQNVVRKIIALFRQFFLDRENVYVGMQRNLIQ